MSSVTMVQQTTISMIFESEKFWESGNQSCTDVACRSRQTQRSFRGDLRSTEEITGGEKSCDDALDVKIFWFHICSAYFGFR